jgi:hypothetical protein
VGISSRLGAEIAPGSINFVYPLSDVISGQHKDRRDRERERERLLTHVSKLRIYIQLI